MKVSTKIDWGGLNKIQAQMANLEKREVAIGYGEEEHTDSGLALGALANIIEKGVRRPDGKSTPPRKFMELANSILVDGIEDLAASVVKNTLLGKESIVTRDLVKIGQRGIESIQMSIDSGSFPALKPETIKIKRDRGARFAESILVDTMELYESAEVKIK